MWHDGMILTEHTKPEYNNLAKPCVHGALDLSMFPKNANEALVATLQHCHAFEGVI